ncbi:hypothetical protein BKE38_13245 [Pseudoroseomonas deserti]|uniref:Metalloprotease n=1 Tax=Teichococcus deserti TaxID=1817963 RepID=A0A1V2H270_9PROT|nr:hypothetical protein BKE38_13245 [Pseudoroseomonas deserti]
MQIVLLVIVLAVPVLAVWGIVGLFRSDAGPAPQAAAPAAPPAKGGAAEQDFATRLLEETTRSWTAQFRLLGRTFQPAAPIFANGIAPTACDGAPAPSGLFYCTADARIYVDLDRQARLGQGSGGNGGGMTVALLLAHAVGHHVQQQLGILDLVRGLQARLPEAEGADSLRRRVELQADCFAGLWAKTSSLVPGMADTAAQEAAFAAMRDDAARPAPPAAAPPAAEPASAAVVPQAPAPLTAAERAQWFRTGLQRGDFAACDTFSGLP